MVKTEWEDLESQISRNKGLLDTICTHNRKTYNSGYKCRITDKQEEIMKSYFKHHCDIGKVYNKKMFYLARENVLFTYNHMVLRNEI